MIYYAQTNLIAILVGVILLIQVRKQSSRNETSQIIMKFMFALLIALSVSDLAAYYFRGNNRAGVEIANMIYFITMALGTYVWFNYILVKTGYITNLKYMVVGKISIPMWILIAMMMTNPWTHFFFSVDDHLLYHRGIGTYLTWIVEWGYMLAAFVMNIRAIFEEKRSYRRGEYRGYLMYAIPITIAAICQMLFYGTTTIQSGYMAALLLVYLNQQYYQVQQDELTELNNKNAFLSYQDSLFGKNITMNMTIFMIDADYFKMINDNYGHLKGDQALKDIASVLKTADESVPHTKLAIFRYGGDEFIVVGRDMPEEDIATFQNAVMDKIRIKNQNNKEKGEPYNLSVSIGTASKQCENLADFDGLIKAADEAMYQVKKEKKALRK